MPTLEEQLVAFNNEKQYLARRLNLLPEAVRKNFGGESQRDGGTHRCVRASATFKPYVPIRLQPTFDPSVFSGLRIRRKHISGLNGNSPFFRAFANHRQQKVVEIDFVLRERQHLIGSAAGVQHERNQHPGPQVRQFVRLRRQENAGSRVPRAR